MKKNKISKAEYDELIKKETEATIRFQEDIGLDVLVHGEFERNDMVEYFGEKLEGFAFTDFGWVQSYGSRCVKPRLFLAMFQEKSDDYSMVGLRTVTYLKTGKGDANRACDYFTVVFCKKRSTPRYHVQADCPGYP